MGQGIWDLDSGLTITRYISDIFNFSKNKDFSEGCHLVLVVGNCQPALVLTKEDIELHFNINMIGVRGEKGGWRAENKLLATDTRRAVKLIMF